MIAIPPLGPICFRLGARVCPLYRLDDAGRAYLVGSGVPVSLQNDHFLVTAAHVMKDSHEGRLITINSRETIVIGGDSAEYAHVLGRTIDADIAAIRLTQHQAHEMGSEFVFTYLEDVDAVLPYDKLTLYAIVGYPHSKNRPKPRTIRHFMRNHTTSF